MKLDLWDAMKIGMGIEVGRFLLSYIVALVQGFFE